MNTYKEVVNITLNGFKEWIVKSENDITNPKNNYTQKEKEEAIKYYQLLKDLVDLSKSFLDLNSPMSSGISGILVDLMMSIHEGLYGVQDLYDAISRYYVLPKAKGIFPGEIEDIIKNIEGVLNIKSSQFKKPFIKKQKEDQIDDKKYSRLCDKNGNRMTYEDLIKEINERD